MILSFNPVFCEFLINYKVFRKLKKAVELSNLEEITSCMTTNYFSPVKSEILKISYTLHCFHKVFQSFEGHQIWLKESQSKLIVIIFC